MDENIKTVINNINIDNHTILTLFHPVISGQILNAYYSSLILKKLSGKEITPEIEGETLGEVFSLWGRACDSLKDILENKKNPKPSD